MMRIKGMLTAILGLWVSVGFAQSAQEAYGKGTELFAQKKYQEAVEQFNLALIKNPDFVEAYAYRGTSEYYLGNVDGAGINWYIAKNKGLADAEKLITNFLYDGFEPTKVSERYMEEGNTKFKAGDFHGAIVYYTNVIYLKPDYYWAYNKRAYAKARLKKFEEAVIDYNKAIELNPTDPRLFTFRGLAKMQMKDKTGACEDIKKGVAEGHKNAAHLPAELGCN